MANKPVLPLQGPAPKEIPLPNAPLVSVIAQVRFPTRLAVRNPDRIIGFQDLIGTHYPHLERRVHSIIRSSPPSTGGEIRFTGASRMTLAIGSSLSRRTSSLWRRAPTKAEQIFSNA